MCWVFAQGKSVRVDEGWDVLAFAQRFQGPVKIFTATLSIVDPGYTTNGQGLGVDATQAKQFVAEQIGGTAQPQDRCVN